MERLALYIEDRLTKSSAFLATGYRPRCVEMRWKGFVFEKVEWS